MKKNSCVMAFLCVCLIMLIGCQSNEPLAQLSALNGSVTVKKDANSNFELAKMGVKLYAGGIIKTDDDSSATFTLLPDEAVIELKSNTYLELDNKVKNLIAHKAGNATYNVNPQKSNLKITTPQGMATVLGTVLTLETKETETMVTVNEGSVDFTKLDGAKITIKKGEQYSTTYKENKARKIGETVMEAIKVEKDEAVLAYGDEKHKLAFINQNKYPGIEEPIPFGPLSFRVIDNNFWIADSVAGKLVQVNRENKVLAELSVIPENQVKPQKAYENDPCLQVLIEDFAPIKGEYNMLTAILVAESMENRLILVDLDGKIQKVVNIPEFKQLYKIEISAAGTIYVADKGAQRIFVFDSDLNYLEAMSWEWSGLAVSQQEDVLYRVFFTAETGLLTLVGMNRDKEIVREVELMLPMHLNPELCWVDEEKQECLISYVPDTGFDGKFMLARVSFDGSVIKTTEMKAPIAMNRYIDKYHASTWVAEADYNSAPKGVFKLKPFKLY